MTSERPEAGTIGWLDLTVSDAESLRDFYAEVIGWRPQPVEMGGYSDNSMATAETGKSVAGVCHARGVNAALPPVWLIYINVTDLDASLAACRERGGKLLAGPKEMAGYGRYAVIQDPAGAALALWEPSAGK